MSQQITVIHRQISFTSISRGFQFMWILREILMNFTSNELIRETHVKSVYVSFTWILCEIYVKFTWKSHEFCTREIHMIFLNKVIQTTSKFSNLSKIILNTNISCWKVHVKFMWNFSHENHVNLNSREII